MTEQITRPGHDDPSATAVPATIDGVDHVPITVNRRRFEVAGPTIERDRIIDLAFPNMEGRAGRDVTILYRNGPAHAPKGVITGFAPAEITREQDFVVHVTDRS